MKRKCTLTLLLVLWSWLCPAQTGSHRALLVGVAHYPQESGWDTIHSDNDVSLLKGLLADSFTLETLVDQQATYANITAALSALGTHTQPGDTVLILFSCHGQQMGRSDEPDSLDEALIPYDAQMKQSATYRGEHHIRDDELSAYIQQIRMKAGADGLVVVLLDACHSGNSYRDVNGRYIRGVYDVFGLDMVPRIRRDREEVVGIGQLEGASEVVYISACQSYESNNECQPEADGLWYGSLAYAFAESYRHVGLADLKALCEAIRGTIRQNSSQYPEFAVSEPTMADELRRLLAPAAEETAVSNEEESGDHRCLLVICAVLAAVVVTLFLIRLYERRKRK